VNHLLENSHLLAIALFGAICMGAAKSGFSGLSLIAVFIFADVFGAKASTGIILPMLIIADLTVYPVFRKYGSWRPVMKLLIPALIGIAIGYWLISVINDIQARRVIGISIVIMIAIHSLKIIRKDFFEKIAESKKFFIISGMSGGMATMMANAAGPIIQLYLLSQRFPKMELLGVSARYFLLINIIKLPLSAKLSFVTVDSLKINLMLIPAVWLGIFGGKYLVKMISQQYYEIILISFSLVAGLRLCFF
jgi:uncharacterized protein